MNLKTSYFNMPIFKSNLKRFWWIAAVFLIAYLTVGVLILFDTDEAEGFAFMNAFAFGAGAVMPAIFFSYLNNAGALTALHAFPMKRRAHFITNIASIYTLILVPAIICYAIGLVYCAVYLPSGIDNMLEYFALLIICITISSSGATLGAMVTGNTVAAIAFAGIFAGLPYYSEAIIKFFLSENLHGMWYMNYYCMENMDVTQINTFMTVQFAAGIAVFFLSWLLYKNRKLETNGDIISFNFLKPVFVGCVAVFAGLLGYFYLNTFFGESIFNMLPFGIIGAAASYMLAKRAVKAKGLWKPVLIYCVFVLLVHLTVTYDLTGFERRVPDIDDIASIDLLNEHEIKSYRERGNYRIIDGRKYYMSQQTTVEDLRYTSAEDFENITRLHEYLTKNRDGGNFQEFPIIYNLKNGRQLKRVYRIDYIEDKEYLEPVYMTQQMKKKRHEWLSGKYKTSSVRIEDERLGDNSSTFAVFAANDEKAERLIKALLADVKEAEYEDVVSYNNSMTRIMIDYEIDIVDDEGNAVDDRELVENWGITTDSFGVSRNYKRTIAVLREYGLYDKIIKPEQIAYAELQFNYMQESIVKIENPDDIRAIYDYVSDSQRIHGAENFDGYIHSLMVTFFDKDNKPLFNNDDIAQFIQTPPQILIYESEKFVQKIRDEHAYGDEPVAAVVERATYSGY